MKRPFQWLFLFERTNRSHLRVPVQKPRRLLQRRSRKGARKAPWNVEFVAHNPPSPITVKVDRPWNVKGRSDLTNNWSHAKKSLTRKNRTRDWTRTVYWKFPKQVTLRQINAGKLPRNGSYWMGCFNVLLIALRRQLLAQKMREPDAVDSHLFALSFWLISYIQPMVILWL